MMLVEHHKKYKEIHGIDETVWMTQSDHLKLHRRLRREGKCQIPVKELGKIAHKAMRRTKKCKLTRNKLMRGYHRKNRIHFTQNIGPKVSVFEDIMYYPNSGNVLISSYFQGNNGNKLLVIQI